MFEFVCTQYDECLCIPYYMLMLLFAYHVDWRGSGLEKGSVEEAPKWDSKHSSQVGAETHV